MKMSKVGNQTNSQDPQAVNSRVFVGNLNTFQCSKTDVERMFQRYGRIAGISMHKGYAFVQFTNPFDARSACLGEDGRTVLGQVLDVNMVAEPKPHQTGRKRQNVAKTGNDWDYYYDSYYASAAFPPGPPRLVPPLKRPRLMVPPARPVIKTTAPQKAPAAINQLKTYSNPDILICGNCREMFTDLQELLDHKKTYCKLRFTCKCHTLNGVKTKPSGEHLASAMLLCVLCKDSFQSAWDLMVHVQAAHMMNIYELGVPKPDGALKDEPRLSSQQTSPSHSPCHCPAQDKQDRKKVDREDTPTLDDDDDDAVELTCDGLLASPDKTKDDLEELMAVESTAQACIMHALHIEQSAAGSQGPGGTPSEQPVLLPITNGELSAQE